MGNTFLLCLVSLIGLSLVLYTFIQLIVALTKYEKVKAICIHVERYDDDDGATYKPVWEYYYNCQKYTSAMSSSSSFLNIRVGKEKTIYVNPRNPLKIYTFFLSSIIFPTIVGLVFFLLPLAVVIDKLKN